MGEQLEAGAAVLVYFDVYDWPHLPTRTELEETLSLHILEETADGVLYGSDTLKKELSP